ncbi:MAG: hypothetical protein KME67_11165 [Candidatus Thiodiazotropha sp. (ex Codakia orbicularis)]|nr:hypothetical protein [Candidatus Thiodiazotropha sp. (ex Codakia orbicularis)]
MMALKEVSASDVLATSRSTLGLPPMTERHSSTVDDEFLAALVRHSAGFLCPCSTATLRLATKESLQYLVDDVNLVDRIDEIIETLTIGGDLLELRHVTTNNPAVKGTWLFIAPPSYVVRSSEDIFLSGIVADQDTYLPRALVERIRFEGCTRVISPVDGEDLVGELTELGLQRISEDNWLRAPREQSAENLHADYETRLESGTRSGSIPDLEVLDPEKAVIFYRSRWQSVNKQTGTFVARRPQEYGPAIWCFVELQGGKAQKLLDFPLARQRWRGCDAAWHLQMAIDYLRGKPQCYRLRSDSNKVYLDLFSPLPLWAQRRLMIIGRRATPNKCLVSFEMPKKYVDDEVSFLHERLWLTQLNKEEL